MWKVDQGWHDAVSECPAAAPGRPQPRLQVCLASCMMEENHFLCCQACYKLVCRAFRLWWIAVLSISKSLQQLCKHTLYVCHMAYICYKCDWYPGWCNRLSQDCLPQLWRSWESRHSLSWLSMSWVHDPIISIAGRVTLCAFGRMHSKPWWWSYNTGGSNQMLAYFLSGNVRACSSSWLAAVLGVQRFPS